MVVLSTYETYDIQGSKFLISILGPLYKILLYILPIICGIGIIHLWENDYVLKASKSSQHRIDVSQISKI